MDANIWEGLRFDQEKLLSKRLRTILYADLLEPIFARCRYAAQSDYWQSVFAGQSFRLTPRLAPQLYKVCAEVQKKLNFEEPVEFFVSNDPTVNAAAYLRESDQHSHLLVLHSALIESFSEAELRFTIGHELAHIIYKTAQLRRLINNLFPPKVPVPIPVRNMIRLWEKFAEISADRLGYVASPDLDSSVSHFFKLSSGLSGSKVDFSAAAYLEEVDTILAKFSESAALFEGSHPTNPVRVKAIQYFSESQLYHDFHKHGKVEEDPALNSNMEELVQLLELHPDNERDQYRLILIAAGGLFMAGVDKAITVEEEEKILEYIASFTVYPRLYLENIMGKFHNRKELEQIVLGAIEQLMDIDPSERYPLFNYLGQIVIADREINQQEINLLMEIATRYLGMHAIEASREFVQILQEGNFQPRF